MNERGDRENMESACQEKRCQGWFVPFPIAMIEVCIQHGVT
jgi:hypothetical protein